MNYLSSKEFPTPAQFTTPRDIKEKSMKKTKEIMISSLVSLHDSIHLRPQKSATCAEYADFASRDKLSELPNKFQQYCFAHLWKNLTRKFMWNLALDSFMELMENRLSILSCHTILEHLDNQDLYHICLMLTPDPSVEKTAREKFESISKGQGGKLKFNVNKNKVFLFYR
uniref:MULE transposase domain-containing protein n=1 Tax=Trichogramma kaykai TaxID=54128 RepID=A0ABD2VWL8_9HYME